MKERQWPGSVRYLGHAARAGT